ncbi:MAG: hypothetical protein J7J19_01745 [Thaumarchaeota archaeon]|nr:hypothetical protein [Nitrososphaerota archaeon]
MTVVKNLVKKSFFRDSLQLMRLSEEVKRFPGILDAAVLMATDTNKEILQKLGLLTSEGEKASKDDMILAVKAEDESAADEALKEIEDMLMKVPTAARRRLFQRLKGSVIALTRLWSRCPTRTSR